MGAPDQLAKRIFVEELPALFGDKATFHPGLDLGFAELRLDGVLSFTRTIDTSDLPAPWCTVRGGRISVEVKMPGDHVFSTRQKCTANARQKWTTWFPHRFSVLACSDASRVPSLRSAAQPPLTRPTRAKC